MISKSFILQKKSLFLAFVLCVSINHAYSQGDIDYLNDGKNNLVTVNVLPATMTILAYERGFFKTGEFEIGGIGASWSYYWPNINGSFYGFHNDDGIGTHNDIPGSDYNIKGLNRFDIFLKGYAMGTWPKWFYVKLFMNYDIAQGLTQIYYNAPFKWLPDSSVTSWLAASPNNKVFYRTVNFNSFGGGLGIGASFFIGHPHRILIGFDFGLQLGWIPWSAKQNLSINGVDFYYHYTPAWESTINYEEYGHITLSYRF